MADNCQGTREEGAHYGLLEENWKTLSEPARSILSQADYEARAANLISSHAYQPERYDEALEEMYRMAAVLTEEDRVLLAEFVGAARSTVSSIDPDDVTSVGHKVCRGQDLRRYYEWASNMVEELLGKFERMLERVKHCRVLVM